MTTAEPELGFLLEAFQLSEPQLTQEFYKAARPVMRRMAAKHGYGLSDDLLDDVVQEALVSIANPEHVRFDTTLGTAHQYLLGRVFNAVKAVQVVYGLRRSGTDFDAEPQREFVPIDDDMQLKSQRGIPVESILARHSLNKLFADVDARVAVACMRVYGDGESQSAVAADMNISRFALARQMMAAKASAVQMLAAA